MTTTYSTESTDARSVAQELPAAKQRGGLWHSARESFVGKSWRSASRFIRNVRRAPHLQPVIPPDVDRIAESMAAIDASSSTRSSAQADSEAPIFVLASGWRTGSTLLQRILVTDPNVLIWGEPLGDVVLLSKIAEMLAQVPTFHKLNRCAINGRVAASDLAVSWIANLCPQGEDFRSALRLLVDRWLGKPALKQGFVRWGFKEVRLGAAEAMILHWLYPRAKFVFLTRHPYASYRSLADSRWDEVYYSRPDVQVDSAPDYARHWNRLVVSWSRLPADFPAVYIKYEHLVNGEVDFRKLEEWLGIRIREEIALSVVVGRTSSRAQLSWHERWMISRAAAQGMDSMGYSQ